MIMIKTILFLFIHTAVLASSQKELLSLHQKAEAAMRKENYIEAKEVYAELIQKIEEKGDGHGYIDSVLRYAEALIQLHELTEADQCLEALLAKQPHPRYYKNIKFLQARTKTGPEGLLLAYKEMSLLKKEFSFSEWPAESRLFFHSLEISINDYFETLLRKAHLFYITYDYQQALSLYHQIEKAIAEGLYPKARDQKSLSYKKIQLAIANTLYKLTAQNKSLTQSKEIEDRVDCELLHLVAQVDRETRDYQKAITQTWEKDNDNHYLEAVYELGMLYYKNKNWSAAKKQFESMQERGNKKNKLFLVAMTTLAEIYLQEKNILKAQELITLINKNNSKDESLKERTAFLQGKIFLEMKQYDKAIIQFNHALNLSNRHKEQIALCLLHCYLYVENKVGMQKLIEFLLETKERPSALLWSAHCHLLNDDLSAAYILLADNLSFLSEEQQLLAFLLMSKANQQHLDKATEMTYANCAGYDYAWLCRSADALHNKDLVTAIDALELAFAAKKPSLHPLVCFWRDKEYTNLLSLLSKNDGAALSYIEGMIYAYYDEEKAISFFEETIPTSEYGDRIHYMLGTLFYKKKIFSKAKEHFLTLSHNYSDSSLAAAGWYWAAESEEQEQPSSIQITHCRQYLFTEYPESPFCAESYFKLFSLDDYIQGESQAIEHLEKFTCLFPNSTLHIAAYYLLSMHQPSKVIKSELLEKAIAAFIALSPEQRTKGVHYFYIKTLVKKAKLEPENAIVLLKPLVLELARDEFSKEKNGISPLLEECQLLLAKAYIQNKKLYKAQSLLLDIIETHGQCGVQEGYFLALAWQEQGDLAFAAGEKHIALNNYELALKSGCFHLSEGEKAIIYLKKTRCK